MFTAADGNLTSTGIYQDYNNRSYDENYETSSKTTDPSSNNGDILDKVIITLYAIIFVLGTIGNGLVIWIAGFRMKKTISAVWFLNLAIADFLCCASLPLRITEWVSLDLDTTFGYSQAAEAICLSNIILFNINISASVLLLVAMSIDRCVSVMWPFWTKVHRTRKLVRITAAIIWVVSLVLAGLMLFSIFWRFGHVIEWCTFYCRSSLSYHYYDFIERLQRTIQLCRLLIMFVIPFLIILISYVIVFIKLRKSKRSQRSQRPYRIITAVILGFFICWFPYYVWPLILRNAEPGDYITQFCTVNSIITILAFLNSCMNPIIYVFMGQDVKLCFFRSIPSRLEKALSEHPNDQCRERGDCEDSGTTEG